MLAAQYDDFVIEEGAVFDEYFIWKDSDGTAHDITGYSGKMEIRKNKADSTIIDEVTVSIGTSDGRIDLDMTSAETRVLAFDRAYYDVEVSPTANADLNVVADVIRLLEGTITLSRETTR